MFSLELPSIFHVLQLPLLYLNNIFALAIGPQNRVLQLGISAPALVLLISQSLYKERKGEWGNSYAFECLALSLLFTYVDWILLASPDKQRWRKIQHDSRMESNGNAALEQKYGVPQEFWSRVWWGARLATTNRYVGWTSEVKNVPKEVPAYYPRSRFVMRKLARSAIFYLLADTTKAYTAGSPHGSWTDIASIKVPLKLADRTFVVRFWYAWVHIVLTYASLEQANAAYGVLSVATGFANPRDCPSAFGDLRELVTLRKAWSSVWHQQCRRLCSAPGIFIARYILRLRKGSFTSKYLQLFVGFGISGIVHGGASMFMHEALQTDCTFRFFLSQAFIIMVEDHVLDFARSLGIKETRFWRTFGLVWTAFVIGATSQQWSKGVIDRGMWIHDRTVDVFGLGPPSTAH